MKIYNKIKGELNEKKKNIGFLTTFDNEEVVGASTHRVSSKSLTESQKKIVEVCDSMKDLLLYKNQKYGDSALNPNNIFYKGDSTNSIKIRLDDKIGRIKNCEETRINDVADVIGYCTLLLVSIGAEKKDFEKLKD